MSGVKIGPIGVGLSETTSTAQLIAQSNVRRMQRESQAMGSSDPAQFNPGTPADIGARQFVNDTDVMPMASNPTGMMSAGLIGIGRALNAGGVREANQANLNREEALRQEGIARLDAQLVTEQDRWQQSFDQKTGSNADLIAQRNQQHAAIMQSKKDAQLLNQQQFDQNTLVQNTTMAANKLKVDNADVKLTATNKIKGILSDMSTNNQQNIIDGLPGLSYKEMRSKGNSYIKQVQAQNAADDNPNNDVDITALRKDFKESLISSHQLTGPAATAYQTYEKEGVVEDAKALTTLKTTYNESFKQLGGAVDNIDKINGEMNGASNDGVPTSPGGTSPNGKSGINSALDAMALTGEMREQVSNGAKKVLDEWLADNPEARDLPQLQAIISHSVQNAPQDDGIWGRTVTGKGHATYWGDQDKQPLYKQLTANMKLYKGAQEKRDFNKTLTADFNTAVAAIATGRRTTDSNKKESYMLGDGILPFGHKEKKASDAVTVKKALDAQVKRTGEIK